MVYIRHFLFKNYNSMSSIGIQRLRKELMELRRNPIENIEAVPTESNILEWHYVLKGAKGSDYESGIYHGILCFPPEYPLKPPSIQMYTPNGRFKTNTRLCLSMSDFHPETWNPMWSVGTILMGLYSFMLEDSPTYGSMTSTQVFKKRCAKESLEFNCKNKVFCKLFPEYLELFMNQAAQKSPPLVSGDSDIQFGTDNLGDNNLLTWPALAAVVAALVACSWVFFSYIL